MSLPKHTSYPKKIYFATECYRIKFKKGLDCYGTTDAAKRLITIKLGMSRRQTLATLVHEILHVIEFEAPVKLKHKTIYKLERAIMEILIDNFL